MDMLTIIHTFGADMKCHSLDCHEKVCSDLKVYLHIPLWYKICRGLDRQSRLPRLTLQWRAFGEEDLFNGI
jgi:hypothetical protein